MKNNALDAGIPLLTEIIETAEDDAIEDTWFTNATDHIQASQSSVQDDQFIHPATHAAMTLTERDWETLKHELHEKILWQLQDRIDFVIEQRVRDSLAEVLQSAVKAMADQIKAGLHQ
ncbi:hypothetical protein QN360_20560, partial [Glaciimonas sp. CA11.2]